MRRMFARGEEIEVQSTDPAAGMGMAACSRRIALLEMRVQLFQEAGRRWCSRQYGVQGQVVLADAV